MEALATDIINQHLIDPEICIHRNTCEATWPIDTVTHNDDNHVVDVEKYDSYMACIPPCPTGAIDNRRREARASAYGINEQFEWEELPEELNEEQLTQAGVNLEQEIVSPEPVILSQDPADTAGFNAAQFNASLPPWSAAHAYTNLYGPLAERKFISATMVGNFRVTEIDREYDTRHILPDFGTIPFPVLEGQSIGIIPSETDGSGKFEGGKLMLFFGERSKEELPYFGPLQNLPKDFIDINLAFARVPDQPKRHVQDVVRERAVDLAELLKGSRTFFYVCGLKDMAEGVALALCDIAEQVSMSWEHIGTELKRQGRLHMEAF